MKSVNLMIPINGFKPLAIAVIAATLSACGGTGQDVGDAVESSNQQTFSGRAIDGYLARSTVYLDSNNNGTRDAWESWAFTDNEGYYSYNPKTQTNYCASDAAPMQKQYCLVGSASYDNVVVRIDGGYDISTGEPFYGQLSRRLSNIESNAENRSNQIVSPLTSLLTNITDDTQTDKIVSALGLTRDSLDVDYLNNNNSGMADMAIYNAAMKVHKIVSVLSDRLTDTYTEIGENFGTPNDASSVVYRNLAQQLTTTTTDFDTTMRDANTIAAIMDRAEQSLRNTYSARDFDLPSAIETSQIERSGALVQSVIQVVDRVIDRNGGSNFTANDLRGAARTIETLVIKSIEEVQTDNSISNFVNFITDANNTSLANTLLQSLNQDTADLSALVRNPFITVDFDTEEEVRNAAQVSEETERFTQIAGRQVRITDLDLGTAPNNLNDMEFEVYFQGDTTATEGSFKACAKFIEDAHSDGTLGEGNTRGKLVSGYWSLLNAGENGSYSLLMSIEFLGANYSAIVKAVGPVEIDGTVYKQYRFDNDGEYGIWHSEQGLTTTESIPTTDSECQERLPSRIGI